MRSPIKPNPARIPIIIKVLEELWKQTPSKRLGQILVDIDCECGHPNLFYLSDDDLLKILEKRYQENLHWISKMKAQKDNKSE